MASGVGLGVRVRAASRSLAGARLSLVERYADALMVRSPDGAAEECEIVLEIVL